MSKYKGTKPYVEFSSSELGIRVHGNSFRDAVNEWNRVMDISGQGKFIRQIIRRNHLTEEIEPSGMVQVSRGTHEIDYDNKEIRTD